MSARRERLLLVRSGRHLRVALDALGRAYPGAHVTVLATAGTERAVALEGIAPADCIVYDAAPRFDAWPLLRSGLWATLRWRGYDRVAVLWPDRDGWDRANVDRTALLLDAGGFDAIAPDGTIVRRRTSAFLAREARTAALSLAALAVLAATLWIPAAIVRAARAPWRLLAGRA